MFSDGFPDQFNPKGFKFLHKRFKELLIEICELPMEKQREMLEQKLEDWKKSADQTDDIIVLGFRIS